MRCTWLSHATLRYTTGTRRSESRLPLVCPFQLVTQAKGVGEQEQDGVGAEHHHETNNTPGDVLDSLLSGGWIIGSDDVLKGAEYK